MLRNDDENICTISFIAAFNDRAAINHFSQWLLKRKDRQAGIVKFLSLSFYDGRQIKNREFTSYLLAFKFCPPFWVLSNWESQNLIILSPIHRNVSFFCYHQWWFITFKSRLTQSVETFLARTKERVCSQENCFSHKRGTKIKWPTTGNTNISTNSLKREQNELYPCNEEWI